MSNCVVMVAGLFVLGLVGTGVGRANEVEDDVAQCRKTCFRAQCGPAARQCRSDRRNTEAQCVSARQACEKKCIQTECAT